MISDDKRDKRQKILDCYLGHVRAETITMKSKALSVDRIVMRHISGEGYKTISRVLKVSKSLHHWEIEKIWNYPA